MGPGSAVGIRAIEGGIGGVWRAFLGDFGSNRCRYWGLQSIGSRLLRYLGMTRELDHCAKIPEKFFHGNSIGSFL